MKIRPMQPGDLTQFGPPQFPLNLAHTLVCDRNGRIDGILCYWADGHGRVVLDGFGVRPGAPKDTGAWLLRRLVQKARNHGWTQLVGYTTLEKGELYRDVEGVTLDGPYTRILMEVNDHA